jgi:hypothetical protein
MAQTLARLRGDAGLWDGFAGTAERTHPRRGAPRARRRRDDDDGKLFLVLATKLAARNDDRLKTLRRAARSR